MADFGGLSAAQINAGMGFGPGGVGDQSQALLNNNFGNFGQQTDYYSGLGAAYGRGVGEPSGMGSVFDQSAYGQLPRSPGMGEAGLMSPTPMAQQGGFYGGLNPQDWAMFSNAVGADKAQAWAAQQGGSQPPPPPQTSMNNPSSQKLLGYDPNAAIQQSTPQVDWNRYFNTMTTPAVQGPNPYGGLSASDWAIFSQKAGPAAAQQWLQQQGGGFGAPAMPSSQALLGYNPAAQQFDPNQFANRFAAMPGFQQGTPSQYTSSPYTNTQGQTFQPNLPQGFQTQFGADNPNGALNATQQRDPRSEYRYDNPGG